jgi:hypothetical protein
VAPVRDVPGRQHHASGEREAVRTRESARAWTPAMGPEREAA